MKFKTKITGKKAGNTAALVVGVTVGAMASDVVAKVIPMSVNPMYKKVAVAAVGGLALLMFNGSDGATSDFVKGGLIGLVAQPALKASREALINVLPASATQNEYVQSALGLQEATAEAILQMPHLAMPVNPAAFRLPENNQEVTTLSINAADIVG